MLARTLKNNLKDIGNYKMRTKSAKFSSMFSSESISENTADIRQFLRNGEVADTESDYDEDLIFDELDVVTDEEIAEYIVENPDEVQVEFPIRSNIELETGMPFFRAVSYKLGGHKLVNI